MSYSNEQLDETAGEQNANQPRGSTQEIKFNGTEGVMFTQEKDEDKTWERPFKAVVLSIRVTYRAFIKDAGKLTHTLGTNEGKSQQSMFRLTKYEQGNKEVVMSGWANVLKVRYPDLKMQHILYLLCSDGVVRKLVAKGKSLSNLFDYYGQFTKDERKRQFMTVIDIKDFVFEDKQSQESKPYFALIFEKGVKMEDSAMGAVNQALGKLKEQFDVFDKTPTPAEPAETVEPIEPALPTTEKDIPVVKNEDDEISVSELPF